MNIQGIAMLVCVLPLASPEDRAYQALEKSLKEADVVFTGKIGKLNPQGQTNSIPPSTFGDITFNETRALRGKLPEGAKFSYSFREGMSNMDLRATGRVLVAVKGKSVSAVVPASDTNLELAKKIIDGAKGK